MKVGEIWRYSDGGTSQWTKASFSIDIWHCVLYVDEHCALVRVFASGSKGIPMTILPANFNQTSVVLPDEFIKGRTLVSAGAIK